MKITQSYWQLGLGLVLAVNGVLATTSANSVLAQNITLDGTLGAAQTLNGPIYVIPQAAGQTVGSNLFHSFGIFNLIGNEAAFFESAGNINNIFARVTGGSRSIINGSIFTESSNVNLFLVNPSGIVFGPNAFINVGGATRGSFVATTADALVWSNGSQFSATNPGSPNSLLTIVGDPSGFLFSMKSPQPIDVIGSTLRVPEGQSLLFLGGDIKLDSSFLYVDLAEGGRIELGGMAESGTVELMTNGNILSLNFPKNVTLANVSLINRSLLDVTAGNGGSIAINARNIDILGGSQLVVGLLPNISTSESQAGDFTLNATERITISESSGIQNAVAERAMGNAGNINITAGSLLVNNGAAIVASTFGQGNAGSIFINTRESVSFNGTNVDETFPSAVFSSVELGAKGQGGDITIITGTLSVTNGAQLVALSRSAEGSAGNLIINARDRVDFAGQSKNGIFASAASSSLGENAIGNGGDIRITTKTVSVTNGAQLAASTLGQGNAGNIQIKAFDAVNISGTDAINGQSSGLFTSTDINSTGKGGNIVVNTNLFRLSDNAVLDARTSNTRNGGNINLNANLVEVLNGAQIITLTSNSGQAGQIKVNATDRVIINGSDPNFNERVAKFSLNVANVDAASGFFVRSDSSGSAGDIEVNSPFLVLDNGGKLIAESASVNGGNITLNIGDLLLLRRGSQISTTAGTAFAGGNGGNISINTGFIIAVPKEGSDITANAFSGTGGQVQINTQGIFGIEPRPSLTNLSDITASSATGVNGEIIINTPDVDPSKGIVELTTDTVNTARLVDSGCSAFNGKTGSSFSVTGRGGLPSNPDDTLSGDAVWSDTRLTVAAKPQGILTNQTVIPKKTANTVAVVPANGWVFNNKGEVTLVNQASQTSSYSVVVNQAHCHQQ